MGPESVEYAVESLEASQAARASPDIGDGVGLGLRAGTDTNTGGGVAGRVGGSGDGDSNDGDDAADQSMVGGDAVAAERERRIRDENEDRLKFLLSGPSALGADAVGNNNINNNNNNGAQRVVCEGGEVARLVGG